MYRAFLSDSVFCGPCEFPSLRLAGEFIETFGQGHVISHDGLFWEFIKGKWKVKMV